MEYDDRMDKFREHRKRTWIVLGKSLVVFSIAVWLLAPASTGVHFEFVLRVLMVVAVIVFAVIILKVGTALIANPRADVANAVAAANSSWIWDVIYVGLIAAIFITSADFLGLRESRLNSYRRAIIR